VAFALIGSYATGRSPLNARQLLLVNMLTDALPAAALAVSATTHNGVAARGPDEAALLRTVAFRGTTTAAGATAAWVMASMTGGPRRTSTVALVALIGTQLGQILLDSRSPLVVTTSLGSIAVMVTLISTPGVSQFLGCVPLGPLGWAQGLGSAAAATAAAAIAPTLLGRTPESVTRSATSSTPAAPRTAPCPTRTVPSTSSGGGRSEPPHQNRHRAGSVDDLDDTHPGQECVQLPQRRGEHPRHRRYHRIAAHIAHRIRHVATLRSRNELPVNPSECGGKQWPTNHLPVHPTGTPSNAYATPRASR
jgi:hypothetical protein